MSLHAQSHARCRPTFIFPYILQRKREAGVFALDDAHLAEGALAYNSQQAEVVEVHCVGVSLPIPPIMPYLYLSIGLSMPADNAPWSVNTTGLPLL